MLLLIEIYSVRHLIHSQLCVAEAPDLRLTYSHQTNDLYRWLIEDMLRTENITSKQYKFQPEVVHFSIVATNILAWVKPNICAAIRCKCE